VACDYERRKARSSGRTRRQMMAEGCQQRSWISNSGATLKPEKPG